MPLLCASHRRVPSECWPARVIQSGDDTVFGPAQAEQSEVHVRGDYIVLCLKRRKNRPQGSRLTRRCWCSTSPTTCPVHVLGAFLKCAVDALFTSLLDCPPCPPCAHLFRDRTGTRPFGEVNSAQGVCEWRFSLHLVAALIAPHKACDSCATCCT